MIIDHIALTIIWITLIIGISEKPKYQWEKINFPSDKVYCIDSGESLFIGAKDGLYKKKDSTDWIKVLDKPIRSLRVSNSLVCVGLWGAQNPGTFLYSIDDGRSWKWDSRIKDEVHSISVKDSLIILGLGFPGAGEVCFSKNNGKSWVRQMLGSYVYSVYIGNGNMYAGTEDGNLFINENDSFIIYEKFKPWKIYSIYQDKNDILYVAGSKIYFSEINDSKWQILDNHAAVQIKDSLISTINGLYVLPNDDKKLISTFFNKNSWGSTIYDKFIYTITAFDGVWRTKR